MEYLKEFESLVWNRESSCIPQLFRVQVLQGNARVSDPVSIMADYCR